VDCAAAGDKNVAIASTTHPDRNELGFITYLLEGLLEAFGFARHEGEQRRCSDWLDAVRGNAVGEDCGSRIW
jgi:hypothetical protein